MKLDKIDLVSANQIQKMQINPINWIVKDFIPEGLSLLAGRPKVGKSWFGLGVAIAIAEGTKALDKLETIKSKVLYLPYEDNERRIQSRINNIMKDKDAPDNLLFPDRLDFPKIDAGGTQQIRSILESDEQVKFVIIDTFGSAITNGIRNFGNSFVDDYDFMSELQKVALKYQAGILLIHHTRKMIADSVYDEVVGTTGMTASPDTLMILKRYGQNYALHITGRDVEETNYEIQFDRENFSWSIINNKISFGYTAERQDILDAFELDFEKEIQVKELAEKTGRTREATSQILRKMVMTGEIIKGSKTGFYRLPPVN